MSGTAYNQAKSIEKRIEDLRRRSVVKKHNQTPLLLNPSKEDSVKLSLYEENLEELHYKIHQLQCEDMLKEKILSGDYSLTNTFYIYQLHNAV
ncbi:hypothetical protein Prudu_010528 [Prunus dulcis]|uniref:Uncharacterized protein n=1 Tax=Prunus dulcis TaxID=3755 RepID=A0A4Y1R9A1_PRUDU|nr:hypothetical protein Prudu_010528 [Prunus dulcis]